MTGTRKHLALLLAFVATVAYVAPQDGANTPSPKSGQFDFWVGDWNVYDATGNKVGENTIESVEGGAAILESWVNVREQTGTSFSYFDQQRAVWRQVWVTQSDGASIADGVWSDGHMRLVSTADDGKTPTSRTTWTPLPDGTVRQHWQTTDDGGGSWSTKIDFFYERKSVEEE